MMYLASTLKTAASKREECRLHFSRPRSIPDTRSDRLLVNRAQCGEQRAFNELMTKYRHKVLAVLDALYRQSS
jgi:hypothetical protein